MDEAAMNEAINARITAQLETPDTLAQCGWFHELGEPEQQVVRTVLYAELPAYYNPALETTLITLIGLVTGYELILQSMTPTLDTAPSP